MIKCSLLQLVSFVLLLLLLLCGFEIGIFSLLNWPIELWYVTLIIMILLHLLFARLIIPICFYEWKVFFVGKLVLYRSGRSRAMNFRKTLHSTQSLLQPGESGCKLAKNAILFNKKIKKCKDIVEFYLSIFESILSKKKKLSSQQVYLFKSLKAFHDSLSNDALMKQLSTNDSKHSDIVDLSEKQLSKELQMNCLCLIRQLDDYSFEGKRGFSYQKMIKVLFDDLISNVHISRAIFEETYKYFFEEHQVKTRDNKVIDYVIIKSVSGLHHANEKPNLLIYSGPNGGPFELIGKSSFIKLFLNNGIDILHWNYRGYGYSTGLPTFSNGREDILEVYDDAIKLKRWNKIGTIGRSIGGISSCYLARHRKVDLLLSDRTFWSIEALLQGFSFGNVLYWLYKCLLISSSSIVDDYLHSQCYKVILQDPLDEVINEFGSLKTGISRTIIQNNLAIRHIRPDEELINIATNAFEEPLSKKLIHSSGDEISKAIQCDNILSALLSKQDKDDFTNFLIFLADRLKDDAYWRQLPSALRQSQGTDQANTIKGLLVKFFYSFKHSTDNFFSLLKYKEHRRKELFIELFFSNVFIWGCSEDNGGIFSLGRIEVSLVMALLFQ